MSSTVNYDLYITNDSAEKFKNWREKMNGGSNSNMIKIDAALSQKADRSVIVTATLVADMWDGESVPYTQSITVEGLTEAQNGVIDIDRSATDEQKDAVRLAVLAVFGQTDGELTISANGKKPEVDIPVCIILLG